MTLRTELAEFVLPGHPDKLCDAVVDGIVQFIRERESISLNHHEQSDWLLLRRIAEESVAIACAGKNLPQIVLNGAGMFVAGGPNGDNGLSGKKLVVDAYGPTVPIGGGAWSGKDLNKVDRLGGYLARELAVQAVKDCGAREALVTLEYIPGCDAPVTIDTIADGHAARCRADPASVTNSAVTARLVAGLPNLQDMARWGHHRVGCLSNRGVPIRN